MRLSENGWRRRRPGPAILLICALLLSWGCAARHRGPPIAGRDSRLGDMRGGPLFLRIGLTTSAGTLDLKAGGKVLILGRGGEAELATLSKGERLRLVADPDGLSWNTEDAAGTSSSLVLRPVDPDHHLQWNGDPYPGEMRVFPDAGGLTLVNVVELETYLRGVVPWEIGRIGKSGLAALEAQAVAARTYSVAHLRQHDALGFDMWSSVMDQVYRGAKGRDKWCDKAIENTAGWVLRHHGREIEAYYSSTCGGVSSNVHEVWAREARPYLISHPDNNGFDDFCAESDHYRWTSKWTAAQLERILGRTLVEYLDWVAASPKRGRWAGTIFKPASDASDPRQPGALRRMEIVERTQSGRVAVLEVETEAGVYRVRGDRVRWVLTPVGERFTILRSALIDLEVKVDGSGAPLAVKVAGRGFGHGVGLCQTGAIGMARQGFDFQAILKHAYPGATLETVKTK